MALILGIDIGTTSTKAVLFDPTRGVVAEAARNTGLISRQAGWAEEDAELWWRNVCELVRELQAQDVAAIGVTGMVPCVVLSDGDGRILRPSIQQNDARAVAEIGALQQSLSNYDVLGRTGAPITQQSIGPKLMWLATHEPDVWRRTALVQGSYDFIVTRLTGEAGVEANWAVESGLYDLECQAWADEVLTAASIPASVLPRIRQPSDLAGTVAKAAAQETGLREGTPVMAGAADHVAAAFAAGVIDEGDLLIKLGGAGDILMATDSPLIDERLYLDLHVIPGKYLPNGCMATSGSLIRWFVQELAPERSLRELDAEAEAVSAGADGVLALPYFLGEKTPLNDPQARGAFVGLHLGHTRAHLYRAVLESIAYAFRHHMDVFEELGHVPRRVRVSDGGARSVTWTQIIADVLRLPLEVVEGQGGPAMASAFLAGIGVGELSDWRQMERFVKTARTVTPHVAEAYERGYRAYRELYPALKEVPL